MGWTTAIYDICPAAVDRDCNNIRISATTPEVLSSSLYFSLSLSLPFVFVFPLAIIYRERMTQEDSQFDCTDFYRNL